MLLGRLAQPGEFCCTGTTSRQLLRCSQCIVYLTAQAATAELHTAAAAAWLLANRLLSWVVDGHRLYLADELAAQLLTALARPGMADELRSCRHADSVNAAGVLAVSAAQCHVARDAHAVLAAEVALPLAPLLAAVLEAPSNNECGCGNTLSRRLTAAKLLQGVAWHPDAITTTQLPQALASAAAFLTRLDADWEAFWQLNMASGEGSGCGRCDSDSDGASDSKCGTEHGAAAAAAAVVTQSSSSSCRTCCGCDGGIATMGTCGSCTCSTSGDAANSSQQQPTRAVLLQMEHFALSCTAGLSGTMALLGRAFDARRSMIYIASADAISPAAGSIAAIVQHTLERLAALPHSQVSFALLPLLAVLPADVGSGGCEQLSTALAALSPEVYALCGRAAAGFHGEVMPPNKSAVTLADIQRSTQNYSVTCSGLYNTAIAALQQMIEVHKLPASYMWPVAKVLSTASSTLSDREPGSVPATADVRVISSAMWRAQQQLDRVRSSGSHCNDDTPEVGNRTLSSAQWLSCCAITYYVLLCCWLRYRKPSSAHREQD